MLKKKISMTIVASLMLMIVSIVGLSTDIEVDAAASPYINSGSLYYIKNLNSGKYLSVPGSSTIPGLRVDQEEFTEYGNQKWYVNYISTGAYSGFYKIVSYLNSNLALSMENATSDDGVYLCIDTSAATTKQHFRLDSLSNMTHKIFTNSSNCLKALMVKSSQFTSGSKIIQRTYYDTAPAYKWIFEPVSGYNVTNVLSYANANKNARLNPYPDLTGFSPPNNSSGAGYDFYYESTNFVSQCIGFGGKHIDPDGYVYKTNNQFPAPVSDIQLEGSWDYTYDECSWLNSNYFFDQWKNTQTINRYSVYNIIFNIGTSSVVTYGVGDIVLVQKENISSICDETYDTFFMGVITSVPDSSNKGSYIITFHNDRFLSDTALNGTITVSNLAQICFNRSDLYKITFMKFSSY